MLLVQEVNYVTIVPFAMSRNLRLPSWPAVTGTVGIVAVHYGQLSCILLPHSYCNPW